MEKLVLLMQNQYEQRQLMPKQVLIQWKLGALQRAKTSNSQLNQFMGVSKVKASL